ncbi:MAG: beta-propeller domain-containing protein [Polyangiaceae bacterium]|nr:beta-propeller domain-containing protein [Polyangiaceae bacterium]
MTHVTRKILIALPAAMLGLLVGCSGGSADTPGTQPTPLPPNVFESANPSGKSAASRASNATGGASAIGAGAAAPSPGADDSAARAIEEADIIKIEDGRLFALSQYGGLSVIDVSQRDNLSLLGRHKIVAMPFEMYVRQGLVFALYRGYGDYVLDPVSQQHTWVQTSQVVVLDTRDAANIKAIGEFQVPGNIADSRIVGDILYVAAYEDGYCWGCTQNKPRTRVISLNVSDPTHVFRVDEVSFEERTDSYSWQRSISVTDQRMYVAGPVWGQSTPVGSVIQVVDISDPTGDLKEGASIQVAGQVNSRWQMDEYNGALRVISQPFQWLAATPPTVETFRVTSSTDITPLGATTLTLPRPESLQSVRFDGDRGYAITFERTDPLFTIDLRDPAKPAQVGQLEIPGFVYHMEPRGNRLIGLGFDQGNAEGSLHVSIFDVSNMAAPTMLSRKNFGGNWAGLAEGQDQIHKSFRVLDSERLILVPFSGYSSAGQVDPNCSGTWNSGIQLLDFTSDMLALRGVVPTKSAARRGILHDQRLLAVSDEQVEAFDISNRDQPRPTAAVALAQNVTRTASVGSHVLRISQNWMTQATQLDVTTLSGVAIPGAAPALEIPRQANSCYASSWLQDVFTSGNRAYLVFQAYDYTGGQSTQSTRIATVEVSPSGTATVVGQATLPLSEFYGGWYYGYGYGYGYGMVTSGRSALAVGSTVVLEDTSKKYDSATGLPLITSAPLKVMDLSDPARPETSAVQLPAGEGVTGLLASGTVVARSHYEVSPFNADRVRFFLDQVDVSDPRSPRVLRSVNIPGSLVAYDASAKRAITASYEIAVLQNVTRSDCYGNHAQPDFIGPPDSYDPGGLLIAEALGECRVVRQSLQLVSFSEESAQIVGSYEIPSKYSIHQIATGTDRTFVSLAAGWYGYRYYGYGFGACYGGCAPGVVEKRSLPLITVSGLHSGNFGASSLEIDVGDYGQLSGLVASGKHAVLSAGWRGQVSVVNAEVASMSRIEATAEVPGYVADINILGNTAICSLGYDGVTTLPLSR